MDCGQSGKLEKSMKTAMFLSIPTTAYQGYQPDIKVFCTPNIKSCHPLSLEVC